MLTREQHFLLKWHWYEWLGIVAPLALLWWIGSMTTRTGSKGVCGISRNLLPHAFWYGSFCFVVALIVTIPQRLERRRRINRCGASTCSISIVPVDRWPAV